MSPLLAPARAPSRLVLPGGIPGFPDLREARCELWGGADSPLAVLSAVEPPVRLVVAVPQPFFPAYRPEIPGGVLADLGLAPGSELLLVILTLGPSPADTTANLLAPLVVNVDDGRGHQVVLNPADWSAATPVALG